MTWPNNISLLVDLSHNNLLKPTDADFSDFFEFLRTKGYDIHQTAPKDKITPESFDNIRAFLIGVPQSTYLFQSEINAILDFVRNGGSLLLSHRYGGDLIQKTNLNDLTSHFGIYFENTLIKDPHNVGIDTLPVLTKFEGNPIMDGIRKLVFPAPCSLRVAKDAQPLVSSNITGEVEIFNPHTHEWINQTTSESLPLVAYAIYGQGRVIVFGTPDFLVNEPLFGLPSLDNRNFCTNVFNWVMNPVSDGEIRDWMLQQLGTFSAEIARLNVGVELVNKTLNSFDKRIRDLEYKYYSLEGIHIPHEDEFGYSPAALPDLSDFSSGSENDDTTEKSSISENEV